MATKRVSKEVKYLNKDFIDASLLAMVLVEYLLSISFDRKL